MKKACLLLSFLLAAPLINCGGAPATYSVTLDSTTLNISGAEKATANQDYAFALSVKDSDIQLLPDTIAIKVNDKTLTVQNDYTYNSNDGQGKILAKAVTGNITITAQAKDRPVTKYNVTMNSSSIAIRGKDYAIEGNDYDCILYTKNSQNAAVLPEDITINVAGITGKLVLGTDYTYSRTDGKLSIFKGKIVGNITITAEAITFFNVRTNLKNIVFTGSDTAEINTPYSADLSIADGDKEFMTIPTQIEVRVGGRLLTVGKDYSYYIYTDVYSSHLFINGEAITGDVLITANAVYKTRTIRLTDSAFGLTFNVDGQEKSEIQVRVDEIPDIVPFDITVKNKYLNVVGVPRAKDIIDITCDNFSIKSACTIVETDSKITISVPGKAIANDIYVDVMASEYKATVLRYAPYHDTTGGISDTDKVVDFTFSATEITNINSITIDWDDNGEPYTPTEGHATHTYSNGAENHDHYIVITGPMSHIISFGSRDVARYINNINAMVLGNNVTQIYEGSFKYFRNMKFCGISKNSPIVSIGNNAFDGCANLEYINGNNIKTIGDAAFKQCPCLDDYCFENNTVLEKIGIEAFRSCGNSRSVGLTRFKLPDSVNAVGAGAFAYCENLQKFEFNNNPSFKYVPANMFYGCTSLTDCKIPNDFNSIQEGAFTSCKNYLGDGSGKLTIRKNLIAVGENAFNSCEKLTDIVIEAGSKLTYLPAGVFAYTSITKFTVPQEIAVLGSVNGEKVYSYGVFEGCEKLANITIAENNTLERIGANCFYDCASIKEVKIFSNKLKAIGAGAFAYCEALENVYAINTPNVIPYSLNMFFSSNKAKFCVKKSLIDSGAYSNDKTWYDQSKGIDHRGILRGI